VCPTGAFSLKAPASEPEAHPLVFRR